jgi:hypothetical protein
MEDDMDFELLLVSINLDEFYFVRVFVFHLVEILVNLLMVLLDFVLEIFFVFLDLFLKYLLFQKIVVVALL